MSDAEYQSAQEDAPPSTQPSPSTQPAESETKVRTRKTSKASLPTIEEEEIEEKFIPPTVTTRVKKEPKASKPAAAAEPKKTPACEKCRRSKIRCSHRREIGADGQVSLEPVGSPAKARKRKATSVPAEEEQVQPKPQTELKRIKLTLSKDKDKGKEPASEVAEPATGTKRGRGRPRKRPAEEAAAEANEDNHLTPAKRPKTDGKTPDQTEPVEPSETPRPRKHPALASMEGAAALSLHVVMERNLENTLDKFEEKYDASFRLLSESMKSHEESMKFHERSIKSHEKSMHDHSQSLEKISEAKEHLREAKAKIRGWVQSFTRGE